MPREDSLTGVHAVISLDDSVGQPLYETKFTCHDPNGLQVWILFRVS